MPVKSNKLTLLGIKIRFFTKLKQFLILGDKVLFEYFFLNSNTYKVNRHLLWKPPTRNF
jgi:hypothetical protein